VQRERKPHQRHGCQEESHFQHALLKGCEQVVGAAIATDVRS
jgi:hypothetical protein